MQVLWNGEVACSIGAVQRGPVILASCRPERRPFALRLLDPCIAQEGESSFRSDYRPPPPEAFQKATGPGCAAMIACLLAQAMQGKPRNANFGSYLSSSMSGLSRLVLATLQVARLGRLCDNVLDKSNSRFLCQPGLLGDLLSAVHVARPAGCSKGSLKGQMCNVLMYTNACSSKLKLIPYMELIRLLQLAQANHERYLCKAQRFEEIQQAKRCSQPSAFVAWSCSQTPRVWRSAKAPVSRCPHSWNALSVEP